MDQSTKITEEKKERGCCDNLKTECKDCCCELPVIISQKLHNLFAFCCAFHAKLSTRV